MNVQEEITSTGIPTKKIVLWIAMGSMIMLFAGLTSAYIVRQAEGNWLHFELPVAFYYSTAVLVLSSLSMNLARISAKKNEQSKLKIMLMITFALGIVFVILQVQGWKNLVGDSIVFAGSNANPSGSFLYVLTGLHIAHLAGGLLSLLYCLYASIKYAGNFTSKNILSIELAAIFWHFLDLLWIYLFLFLLFVR